MGVYLIKKPDGTPLPTRGKIDELLKIPDCEYVQTTPTKLSDAPEGKTFICILGYFDGENAPQRDVACVITSEQEMEYALDEKVGQDDVAFISWLAMSTLTVLTFHKN